MELCASDLVSSSQWANNHGGHNCEESRVDCLRGEGIMFGVLRGSEYYLSIISRDWLLKRLILIYKAEAICQPAGSGVDGPFIPTWLVMVCAAIYLPILGLFSMCGSAHQSHILLDYIVRGVTEDQFFCLLPWKW